MIQTLAVLITVHNRKEKTLKCLQLLHSQLPIEGYQVDIYLTDDGCTDGTPEAIKKQFPKVYIIHGDGNLFWNRGMYTAWKEAAKKDYDFYLWLNDDVFLKEYAFKHILECSKEKDNKHLISGLLSSSDNENFTPFGGRTNGKLIQVNGQMQEIDIMNGNFALIPKSVFKLVGLNDPYYIHSYGDYDYSLTAKKYNIIAYSTRQSVGICDINQKLSKCFDPQIPLLQRFRFLNTPLSYAKPNEVFHFEKKHKNVLFAIFRYLSVYVRCAFPWIWIIKNKIK